MTNKDSNPSSLGKLFREYHHCQNPVTKSVLVDCIAKRLDEIEKKAVFITLEIDY